MAKMICKWCGREIQENTEGKGVFRGLCGGCAIYLRFLIGLTLGCFLVMVLLFIIFAMAQYLLHAP